MPYIARMNSSSSREINKLAQQLAELYEHSFGGKNRGRYRISAKLLSSLIGRKRLYDDEIIEIQRALYESGYVLINLDTYFSVLSAGTVSSYRRVNAEVLAEKCATQSTPNEENKI